jgi:hypothetical protein
MNVQEKAERNASVELWIMDHPNEIIVLFS